MKKEYYGHNLDVPIISHLIVYVKWMEKEICPFKIRLRSPWQPQVIIHL